MNICHVFCYPGTGGAEKYALYLSLCAKKEGHKVFFVLGENGPLCDTLRKSKIPFTVIPMRKFYSLLSGLALKKYFEKNRIDILHTHFLREHFLCVLAKKLGAKIKIIRTIHRIDPIPKKVKPFLLYYQKQTDAFIAVSDYVSDFLSHNGVKKNRIRVINNGVPSFRVHSHNKAIGFLGRLAPEKGILEFVSQNILIFKQGLKLIVGGEGEDFLKLKELVKKERLSSYIEITGYINDVSKFFSQISVLILPSRIEALPLSVLEAFSCGVPVVAFKLDSLKEIINQENGVLISYGNYRGMGEVSMKLLFNKDLLNKLQKGAKNSYDKRYTVEKMWEETLRVYSKLIT